MSLTTSASLRNKANPDDTFEAQLFYGDLKAIVKTSHLVKIDYPKFIVHGHKGSFMKYGIDQQETSLKANIMPGEPGLARMTRWLLEYVNEAGETVREEIPLETGDYGRVYDALYETLVNGQPNYVKESDVLTNMEILSAALNSLLRPRLPLPDKPRLLCACSYFLNRGVNFHPL
jgi:predicted dehydrogenase